MIHIIHTYVENTTNNDICCRSSAVRSICMGRKERTQHPTFNTAVQQNCTDSSMISQHAPRCTGCCSLLCASTEPLLYQVRIIYERYNEVLLYCCMCHSGSQHQLFCFLFSFCLFLMGTSGIFHTAYFLNFHGYKLLEGTTMASLLVYQGRRLYVYTYDTAALLLLLLYHKKQIK